MCPARWTELRHAPGATASSRTRAGWRHNDETSRTGGKDLECGDLSPLFRFGDLSPKQGRGQRPGRIGRLPAFDGDESPAENADKSSHSKLVAALPRRVHPWFNGFLKAQPSLLGKGAEIGAATAGQLPRRVQVAPAERGLFGVGAERAVHFRQRRIEVLFVAAKVVVASKAAGRDFEEIAGLDGRAGAGSALAHFHFHRGGFHGGDVLDKLAGLGAGEVGQGLLL